MTGKPRLQEYRKAQSKFKETLEKFNEEWIFLLQERKKFDKRLKSNLPLVVECDKMKRSNYRLSILCSELKAFFESQERYQ